MAISNYRGFFERRYSRDGVWYEEREAECSQVQQIGTYPTGYYKAIRYNPGLTGGLNYGLGAGSQTYTAYNISSLGGDGCVALYNPGSVYLGKKYYTIRDLFTLETLNGFEAYLKSLCEADKPFMNVKASFKGNNNEVFMSKDGYQLFPWIRIHWDYSTTYKTVSVEIEISLSTTTYDISEIYSSESIYDYDGNWNNGKHQLYVINKETGEKITNGVTDRTITLVCTRLSDHPSDVSEQPKPASIPIFLNKFMNILKKLRFYVTLTGEGNWYGMQNRGYNGETYLYHDGTPKSGYNRMTMIIDIRDCDYSPGISFYMASGILYDMIDRIESGEREPDDPNIVDDPYDNDPGDDDNGGDGNQDDTTDDIVPPPVPPISAVAGGLMTVYNPSGDQLRRIASQLWSPGYIEMFKQFFTSPMEAILGLSIIPVQPNVGAASNVYFGRYNTEVTAPVITSDYKIVDCGSIQISRYWGSYLDYSPYTKISAYLPYIGEVDIDPDQVMGKKLGIKYHVNVITGNVTAILTADGSVFSIASGNCARALPLSQTDYSQIISTAVAAVATTAMAVATGGASIGAAGVTGAAEATAASVAAEQVANVKTASSLLTTAMQSKYHYQHVGKIGTGAGQLAPQKPFLTIERPNLSLAEGYKSYVGYPCNKTKELSKCYGFTQIEATKLSVPSATEEEIAEILSIMTEGVII